MQQLTADTIFLPVLGILFIVIFLLNIFKVGKNSKKKKKAKAKPKSDFAKQADSVNLAIKTLKAELSKLKKLSETQAEKKRVEVTEDRILGIV